MPAEIEIREYVLPEWKEFRWDIRNQRVRGRYKELSEVENGVQKIGVAIEIPPSSTNVLISLVNRRIIDRKISTTNIREEECYTVSYFDSYLNTGRLIQLPRELFIPGEERPKLFMVVEELQVYGQSTKSPALI